MKQISNVKFKYFIRDYAGNIYKEIFDITDIERGKVDSIMMDYVEDGLEPEIVDREISTAYYDDNGCLIYTGDIIGFFNGLDLIKYTTVPYQFVLDKKDYSVEIIGNSVEGSKF